MCSYQVSLVIFLYMQITIPSADTTYWCQSFELPEEVRSATRYVLRVYKCTQYHKLVKQYYEPYALHAISQSEDL